MNIFNRNLLIIVLAPCFSWAFPISYNDIINQGDPHGPYVNNRGLADTFRKFSTREEKIAFLLSFCERRGSNHLLLKIKDIPTLTPGKTTTGVIDITRISSTTDEDLRFNYTVIRGHQPRSPLGAYKLSFNHEETNILYWFIDQPRGILGGISASSGIGETISGSTIMRLVDGLCSLCAVGKVDLIDGSTLQETHDYEGMEADISLSKLYPYIWGETFYMRFGFIPDPAVSNVTAYLKSLNFLTHRPLTTILNDFRSNVAVSDDLLAGFSDLIYFPEQRIDLKDATLKHTLLAPFVRLKTIGINGIDPVTGKKGSYYADLINAIYQNCIINYTGKTPELHKIKASQKIVNYVSVFSKVYDGAR